MITINLTWKTVTDPDFGGWMYFVEEGSLFDADDYADAYQLNRSDIDAQDIHAAQDAAGGLNPGEWLQIDHTIEADDADIMITITHVETTYPPPADGEEDYCPDGESTSVDEEYTFRELVALIEEYPNPSSSHMTGATNEWFSRQDQNYHTGGYITESIHFTHGQNPRSAKYWRVAIRNSK